MYNKKLLIFAISLGIVSIIGLIISIIVMNNQNDDNLTSTSITSNMTSVKSTDSSSNVTIITSGTTYEDTTPKITDWHAETMIERYTTASDSNSNYSSLYGYSNFYLTDEEFSSMYNSLSTVYETTNEASEEQILECLNTARSYLRSRKFDLAYNTINNFIKSYKFTCNDYTKELLYNYVKINLYSNLASGEMLQDEEEEMMKNVKDPEMFLILVLNSSNALSYYRDGRSIYLKGNYQLLDSGIRIDNTDDHYRVANQNMSATAVDIFRFTIKYNDDLNLYVYVGYNDKGYPFLLSVENLDGSFTTPYDIYNETETTIFEYGQYGPAYEDYTLDWPPN